MASVERPAPSERVVDLRSELAAWRRAHPGATLLAIEQEVDRRLAGVRADLVTKRSGWPRRRRGGPPARDAAWRWSGRERARGA